jgi:hypothetical protein
MENGTLDIVIYILIMILGLAATAYRNYSKRKEMEKRKTQGPQRKILEFPDVFDTEEEEIYSGEEEYEEETPTYFSVEEEHPEEVVINEKNVETYIESDKNISELETLSEGTAAFESTEDAIISDDLQKEDFKFPDTEFEGEIGKEVEEEVIEKEINWTDAVIYSEILKRKY